jgi:putative ABC transport system permease protein
MESRLLGAAMWRRRGTILLAVAAVTIGAAVTSALISVSRDIGQRLTHELRALGPNLLVLPAGPGAADRGRPGAALAHVVDPASLRAQAEYLDEAEVRARLKAAGIDGVPILFGVAEVGGRPTSLVGADLAAARRLHPSWKVPPGTHASLMGIRLMRRLGVRPRVPLEIEYLPNGRRLTLAAGAPLETGGADDQAWWIPLEALQSLTGLAGRVSLVQARIEGDPRRASAGLRILERGGGMRAIVLHALSATEAELLDRTRRLMSLVTVAVLVAAALCAFGTLTDLALERRREVALLKALGASRRDLVRLFGGESAVVGLLGGTSGWLAGLLLAQLIGRHVFHAAIRVQWPALPLVLGLSLAVAAAAAAGPIRFALGVDPAPALKGD